VEYNVTLLCVPLLTEHLEAGLSDAAEAKRFGADLVEFRVDSFFHGEGDGAGIALCERLVRESPLPCIVTCRAASEGGQYDGDDAARVALYEHLGTLAQPPRYIDVELATYTRSANLAQKVDLAVDHPRQQRDLRTGLILSAHDFSGRPANLARVVGDMASRPAAAVHKIAFRARSLRDNLELFELLRHKTRPTIALGMGEFGLMSRVLAPKFGGFLTFASLRDTAATAPGQPTIDELINLYRFRSIGPATSVFGVIGWPVGHSMSPSVHNAGFAQAEVDAVYLPLPIPAEWEHFKATVLALLDDKHLDFRGASVTIPHKEHLVRLASEDRSRVWRIDGISRRCGAANTLTVHADGSCDVSNTDAPALVAALEGAIGSVRGMRVAVIGAGGVARAAVCGLLRAGATVVVYNRSEDRGRRLVADLSAACEDWTSAAGGKAVTGPWDKLGSTCCEALVNCTPVGMAGGPAPDESPIPDSALGNCGRATGVLDTVYNPLETPFLKAARSRGLRTVDGAEMFVRQAVMQFEAWREALRGASDRAEGRRDAGEIDDLYRRIVRLRLDPSGGSS